MTRFTDSLNAYGNMVDIRKCKLDDWLVSWFRSQAKQHGTSLEEELRQTLTDAALAKKRAIATEMRTELDALRKKYGTYSDGAMAIREDRDTPRPQSFVRHRRRYSDGLKGRSAVSDSHCWGR